MGYLIAGAYGLFLLFLIWATKPAKKCPHCGAKKYTKDKDGNEVCNFEYVGFYDEKIKCKVCDRYV